jgi:hypothetical protein
MKHFASPLAFKASLEQRLRNMAKESNQDLHRLRQLVVYERFLARVFQSFGDEAVLKGGLVLELRLERARSTKDVDLNLHGNPEKILRRLQEAGRLQENDFLTFEITVDTKHPEIQVEGLPYGGLRFKTQAFLAGKIYGSKFGVDVALADFRGEADKLKPDSLLAFAGVEAPEVLAYPIELHVAEKLHAYTLPRTRPNSRVKDLPDIALLGTVRPIDSEELRTALQQTFSQRETHLLPRRVPNPPEDWATTYRRMALGNTLPWPDLHSVTEAARAFLDPVLEGRDGKWAPVAWSWSN